MSYVSHSTWTDLHGVGKHQVLIEEEAWVDLFPSVRHRPSIAAVLLFQVFLVGVNACLPVLVAVVSADAADASAINGSPGQGPGTLIALTLMVKEVDPAAHLSGVDCPFAVPLPFADDARRYPCCEIARLGSIKLHCWV